MGVGMLSKSLIQFSIDKWGCVPSSASGQNMVGVMALMVNSFKKTYARTVVFSIPNLMAGHCQPTPPLEIPGHSFSFTAQSK